MLYKRKKNKYEKMLGIIDTWIDNTQSNIEAHNDLNQEYIQYHRGQHQALKDIKTLLQTAQEYGI